MIFVGIDDTDMPDTPGTNKLAFHLAQVLSVNYATQWIVRHQLLVDPSIPCTNKNGCVSLLLKPHDGYRVEQLTMRLRDEIRAWSPPGSDPGLCVAESVPGEVTGWGRAAQTELLDQAGAMRVAADAGIYLEPLGGSGGGVIGALAAVGLLATWDSGRVVHCGTFPLQAFDATGVYDVVEVYDWGVDDIVSLADGARITAGAIDLGKRLRPNLR
ncbi:MAG TPA: hypothetical protein VEQ85_15250, partial [Lacipirellulaceae bacterium]|nr:hypothetical protein [Lacipirellulaceae bacterium]